MVDVERIMAVVHMVNAVIRMVYVKVTVTIPMNVRFPMDVK